MPPQRSKYEKMPFPSHRKKTKQLLLRKDCLQLHSNSEEAKSEVFGNLEKLFGEYAPAARILDNCGTKRTINEGLQILTKSDLYMRKTLFLRKETLVLLPVIMDKM